jgi:hypothetical protein
MPADRVQGALVMTWKRIRWVAACGLIVSSGFAAGCTNSDDLSAGVGTMLVQIELTNPSTRFPQAGIVLQQMVVIPLDQNASDALSNDLAILALPRGGIDIDFNGAATEFETTAVLTAGRYRLTSVILGTPIFEAGTSVSTATCQEYFDGYPRVTSPIELSDFGSDVILNVEEDTGTALRMVLDGGSLLAAFQDSWTCRPSCQLFNPFRIVPWCLVPPTGDTAFREFDFVVQSPTFLQFP